MAKMNRKKRRYGKKWRRIIFYALLVFAAWWMLGQQWALPVLATVFGIGMQLAFALFYMIVQFWGLMYFLSGTRTEKIMPSDARSLTLDDYKGQPVITEYARYLVQVLEGQGRVKAMGGEPPKGILLIGKPGVGKTYLAKCLAGTARIPFFLLDAGSLQSMWMGVSGLKIRRFFAVLKKNAQHYGAAVAVIDELDAIGGARGGVEGATAGLGGMFRGGFGGGMGLNTLLSCMDGLDGPSGVMQWLQKKVYGWLGKSLPKPDYAILVIGSTNRPDSLDSALTRAGRFDQQIRVKVQNVAGLQETVAYYLDQVANDGNVDTLRVAQTLHGITPAEVKTAVKRGAVQRAAAADRDEINERDIYEAAWEAVLGIEMPEAEPYKDDQFSVAAHESGHAIACVALFPELKPLLATIIPHAGTGQMGASLGVVIPRLTRERQSLPLDFYARRLMMSMAGREAAALLTGRMSTGFGGDLTNMQASLLAMVKEGAFGYTEAVLVNPGQCGLFSGMPRHLESRIKKYLDARAQETQKILKRNRRALEALTTLLMKEGTLTADTLEVFFEQHRIRKSKTEVYDVK